MVLTLFEISCTITQLNKKREFFNTMIHKKTKTVNKELLIEKAASPHKVEALFANKLLSLESRAQAIVTLRSGIFGEPMTLSDVGDLFNLTKERVRVIEKDCFEGDLKDVTDYVEKLVTLADQESAELIKISGPEIEKYFPSASEYLDLLSYLIEKSGSPKKVTNVTGYLCELREAQINALRSSAVKSIRNSCSIKARSNIEGASLVAKAIIISKIPPIFDRKKTIDFIVDLALQSFRFSDEGDYLGTVLSESSYVLEALQESTQPMFVKDIRDAVSKMTQKTPTMTYIRNICIDHPMIFNFGPSLFGVEKHLKIDKDTRAKIEKALVRMVNESPKSALHHEEAYNELIDKGVIKQGDLSSYKDLSVITEKSKFIMYLGYHRFTSKEKGADEKTGSRLISQEIENLLLKNEGPMSAKDIVENLKKTRNLRSTFQVSTWGKIAPAGDDWGLIGRDLPYNEEGAKEFTEFVMGYFKKNKEVPYNAAKEKFFTLFKWEHDYSPHGAYLAAIARLQKVPCRYAHKAIRSGYVKRREKTE